MGLFSTTISIQFGCSRLGQILMALALGILGAGSLLPVFMDPELPAREMMTDFALAAALWGIAACCFIHKIWLNRWFACFLVALLALFAGRAFGWAAAEWISPTYDHMTNYWLQTWSAINPFLGNNYFVMASPALLLLVPIVLSAMNWLAAATAFIGLTLLLMIPASANFLIPGMWPLAFGFSLLTLIWPRLAVSIVCVLVMIPLAAVGAGTIGSWSMWRD